MERVVAGLIALGCLCICLFQCVASVVVDVVRDLFSM